MSLNNIQNTFLPYTLNGLQDITADTSTIENIQVLSLNPNKVIVSDNNNFLVSSGASSTEVEYLIGTSSNIQNQLNTKANITYVDTNFLNKTTTSAQTVAGQITFQKPVIIDDSFIVNPMKTANLSDIVDISPNYKRNETDASITANYLFGSISNTGGIYTATTIGNFATLGLANLTADKLYKINIYVRAIPTASYTTSIQLYSSVDGITPGIPLDYSASFNPSSPNTFQLITGNFIIPVGYTQLILLCLNTNNPTYITPVEWYGLELFDMGVSQTNVSMPSQTADRVLVLNDKKQVVSSGINTTKLGYLDNVSSDIQTQLNSKASTTDLTNGLALKANLSGGNTITGTQTYSDQTSDRVAIYDSSKALVSSSISTTTLGYLDATSSIQTQLNSKADSSSLSNYVLKSGDTMTGNLTLSGTGTTSGVEAKRFYLSARGDNQDDIAGDEKWGPWYGVGDSGISGFTGKPCLAGYYGCALRSGLGYMVLDENGRVGIGKTDPQNLLDIAGASRNSISGSGADTTAYHIYTTTSNHYNNNPSTTYLMSGLSGYLTLANKTTRTDGDACIMWGTNSDISEVTSVTTDGSDLMPLNFGGSSFLFTGGQLTVDNTSQLRNTFIRSGYYLVCNNGNDANNESTRTQIAFAWQGSTNQYRHRITSEHQGGDGPTGNGNSINFYLWSNSNGVDDLGTNHRMTIAGKGVGIGTTDPIAGLTVYDTTSDYTNNVYLQQPWPGIVMDNTHMGGSGRKWALFNGGSGAGIGQGNFGIYDITANAYRFSINSDGQAKFHSWFRVENGDISTCVYGPNSSWNSYLRVGAATSGFDTNTAQVISTNGNLHLDAGYYKDLYLNFYCNLAGQLGTIYSYGSWTHYGIKNIHTGANQNFLTLFAPSSNTGEYINLRFNHNGTSTYVQSHRSNSSRTFLKFYTVNDSGGNVEIVNFLDTGMICFGTFLTTGSAWCGNTSILGDGCSQFSQAWDRWLCYANGYNTFGGYAYYNQGNALGTISDRRIKRDFQRITEEQSVAFLKALEPTSFCLKEQKPCKRKRVNEKGEEVEEDIIPSVCSCRQDGWIAQNVLEACEVSGASKSVVNNWYDYQQELNKPEEEQKTLIGVSDRPILSHTVNVVKALLEKVDRLEERNQILLKRSEILENHARKQENDFNDYKKLTDLKIEKMAILLQSLIENLK